MCYSILITLSLIFSMVSPAFAVSMASRYADQPVMAEQQLVAMAQVPSFKSFVPANLKSDNVDADDDEWEDDDWDDEDWDWEDEDWEDEDEDWGDEEWEEKTPKVEKKEEAVPEFKGPVFKAEPAPAATTAAPTKSEEEVVEDKPALDHEPTESATLQDLETSDLNEDEILDALEHLGAATADNVSDFEKTLNKLAEGDDTHLSPDIKQRAEEFKRLYSMYGHQLDGLNPNNPGDMVEIQKLIEIVGGIPHRAKQKKATLAPRAKRNKANDPLITFSARNIPVRDAFATLARISGKSITVTGLIRDRDLVSVVEINEQPFSDAFMSLVTAAEVDYQVSGENFTVLKRRGGTQSTTLNTLGMSDVDTSLPVEDRRADLAYDGESLDMIIKDIANKYGVDIVMTATPTEKVTMRVRAVTADEGLQLAFAGSQYQYTRDGDAFVVYSRTNKNFSLGRKTVFFPIKYLEAQEISNLLPAELKSLVRISANQNALIAEGSKDELIQIFEFLRTIDKPIPQVQLDVKLVEVSKNFSKTHGILADSFSVGRLGHVSDGSGFIADFSKDQFSIFKQRPDFNQNNTTNHIKVSQRLLVTSGKSATINFDQDINVVLNSADAGTGASTLAVQSQRIQRITAGNSMEITPTVGAGGIVSVKINVEVSANGAINPSTGVPESTTRRKISSEIQVANHETIAIGGLFDDQRAAGTANEIPLLAKIPFVGGLFANSSKSKRQTELLVLITPHLKTTDGSSGISFIQADHT